MRCFSLLCLAALAGCGVTDPNVIDCGDDCPGPHGAGAGGMATAGATPDGSVGDAQAGLGGASGIDGGGQDGRDAGGQSGAGGQCGQCPSEAPYCEQGACVQCSEDAHCGEGACIAHACAACRDDRDCKDPDAAQCSDEHTCVPCQDSSQCMHLSQTPVCDDGACVQCTAQDSTACGSSPGGATYVCDVLERTCSSTATRRSAGLCESCVSDEQCATGQLCVLQRFDQLGDEPNDGEQDVGYFCLFREDASEPLQPQGDCANVPPYFSTLPNRTSIGGSHATICDLAVTTCPAYRDFRSKPCEGLDDDASCGDPRFDDGYCRQATTTMFRCTTPCGSTDDCKMGFECASTVPSYCSLQ